MAVAPVGVPGAGEACGNGEAEPWGEEVCVVERRRLCAMSSSRPNMRAWDGGMYTVWRLAKDLVSRERTNRGLWLLLRILGLPSGCTRLSSGGRSAGT